jgi:uncharacterized protein YndB with AHSA1/START domain
MATRVVAAAPTMDVALDIGATPRAVLNAFFDGATLNAWCGTTRSVTTPRALGPFALEWATTEDRDDVLGRLGGVLRGTVMQFEGTRGFFVADVYWLPPDTGPIGPMAIEVTCTLAAAADGRPGTTRVRMVQSGFEESVRWRRYYEVSGRAWVGALDALKARLESTR